MWRNILSPFRYALRPYNLGRIKAYICAVLGGVDVDS